MTYLTRPSVLWAAGRGSQLLAAVGMVFTLAACGGPSAGGSNPTASVSTASPSPSFGVPVASSQVLIKNFAFAPQAITVKIDTEVTWTHNDADAHTVTFDADGKGSAAFQNGQTYKHTFTSAGTFKYHCSLHPYMHGEVVVAPA